ncbi:hypothetical protein B296_00042670 [Ensete ventricosum]|uniref:Ionotropic glutamate receptor C-terminal domain-containing protein n=1 Tax=Ensete ventricosum TaxID=4639 RepID=A0A426Z7V5_ENSVE|nr:hypothetical protein B296_00042670 [Ensete ventricosum]
MPYTESGVSMIVPVEGDKSKNMWIFLEPLTIDLWLGSLAFFVFTGFVVWVIEHRENEEFAGKPMDQFGIIFYFAFSILVFSHRVDAIFDEIPYLRLVLSQHCDDLAMVGPTYKTDGFGFVSFYTSAILNITEGERMTEIQKAWFGDPTSCPNQSKNFASSSLAFRSFGGLFLITGVVSVLALLIFLARFIYTEWDELKAAAGRQSSLWKKMVVLLKYYHDVNAPLTCPTLKRDDFAAIDIGEMNRHTQPHLVGSLSPVSISNHSRLSFTSPEEGEGISSTEPNSP